MKRLQRYDLLEPIACGGMGEVFRGRVVGEHGFEKAVAVKRIRPALSADPEFIHRFVAEAKLTVSLSHANIVQVLDFSRADDALLLVMEHLHGSDLAQLLRVAGEPVPVALAVHIASEALRGLVFAHERTDEAGEPAGTLHCDISPSNILVSYAGEVKITDFGVAQALDVARRHGGTPRVIGKSRYMSPEQRRGSALDAGVDLYALAVVLCEMLTLDRKTPVAELAGRVRALHPGAPPLLAQLLERATAADPAQRPRSARAMLVDLTQVARELAPVTAPDVGAWAQRLMPARARGRRPSFDGALKQLLGGRCGERTATVSALAEAMTASFGAQPAPVAERRRRLPRPVVAGGTAVAAALLVAIGRVTSVGTGAIGGAGAAVIAAPARAVVLRSPPSPVSPPPGAPVTAAAAAERISAPNREAPSAAVAAPPPAATTRARPSAPRRALGFVNIYVGPWAHVFVDGKWVGTTPLQALALPAGRHRLVLRNPLAAPRELPLDVAAGKTKLVDLDLAVPAS